MIDKINIFDTNKLKFFVYNELDNLHEANIITDTDVVELISNIEDAYDDKIKLLKSERKELINTIYKIIFNE